MAHNNDVSKGTVTPIDRTSDSQSVVLEECGIPWDIKEVYEIKVVNTSKKNLVHKNPKTALGISLVMIVFVYGMITGDWIPFERLFSLLF